MRKCKQIHKSIIEKRMVKCKRTNVLRHIYSIRILSDRDKIRKNYMQKMCQTDICFYSSMTNGFAMRLRELIF